MHLRRREFMTLAGGAGMSVLTGCVSGQGRVAAIVEKEPVLPGTCPFPIYLNSNENPFGPSRQALEAGSRAVMDSANRYAREERDGLTRDLADFYKVKPEQVLLGCGGIELLKIVADVFCSSARPPVISEPVYEAIDYFAGLRLIRPVAIPAKDRDKGHDLQRMLDAVYSGRDIGMVYVCNPCNPTGNILHKNELMDFIRQIPSQVIIVVDEAYAEYVDKKFFSCVDYVREGTPNIIVIRTFSKIYGLAGLRVGYCLGQPEVLRAMAGHRIWNNINQAGAAAASEALKDQVWAGKMRRENMQTREAFCTGLDELGIEYIPSEAPYVLLSVGRPWEETHKELQAQGIMAGRRIPSMPEHIRMSIGYPSEMEYCLGALAKL